jgi:hypothetical protein
MAQCTAKAKSTGERCRRPAVPGRNVCRYHGGATPRGIASPNFKHGKYSKDLPKGLIARYEQAAQDPELLALRDEIALLDARMVELMHKLGGGEADQEVWKEIYAALEQRRRLVESERRRLVEMQQMITAEQALVLVARVADVVRKYISDRAVLAAISDELRAIALGEGGGAHRAASGSR